MKIIYHKKDPITFNSVCGLGNFDGIHIGHQEIIKKIITLAGNTKNSGIVTFQPPPVSVLTHDGIFFLTTKTEKERIFNSFSIDFIFYFNFDEDFSRQSPNDFVELLYNLVSPSIVVVGENFRFGNDRLGTASSLREIAKGKFLVEVVPRVKADGMAVSSTRVRELLLLGHIPAANRILRREYAITGKVIKGKEKGTKLGYPTINLCVDKEKLLPLAGVYEVKVDIGSSTYKGAMFLTPSEIEIHIINYSGNLYEKEVTVKLLRRLRGIRKFPDEESLKEAIARDIKKVL